MRRVSGWVIVSTYEILRGFPSTIARMAGDSPPSHFQAHKRMYRAQCPLFSDFNRNRKCREILVELCSIKLNENLFSGFRVLTFGQTAGSITAEDRLSGSLNTGRIQTTELFWDFLSPFLNHAIIKNDKQFPIFVLNKMFFTFHIT
jgi:hypothetical protein